MRDDQFAPVEEIAERHQKDQAQPVADLAGTDDQSCRGAV